MRQINIPVPAAAVLSALADGGHEAYAVGGCCRDALLGRIPNDWDICTSALPEDVLRIFPDAIPTGLKHGTVTVRSLDAHIEVTTYRIDGSYQDHRRPEQVLFTRSLTEDLKRRDFTMNAIAADCSGRLTDPFCGADDICRKLIRCVGCAEQRFEEDALRMFRAVRFSAQLGFAVDPQLAAAAKAHAHDSAFLAAERICAETVKALNSPAPQQLSTGFDWGLYDRFLYSSRPDIDLSFLSSLPIGDGLLRLAALAALLEHLKLTSAAGFLRALRVPGNLIRTADAVLSPHPLWDNRSTAEVAAAVGRDNALYAAAMMEGFGLSGSMAKMQGLLSESRCLSVKELAITGRDLMELGYSGPALGQCQQTLLRHVLLHPADNTRSRLLYLARKS